MTSDKNFVKKASEILEENNDKENLLTKVPNKMDEVLPRASKGLAEIEARKRKR